MSVGICPICEKKVWFDQQYDGPFMSQQAPYRFIHSLCLNPPAVKPRPRSEAVKAMRGAGCGGGQ